MTHLKGITRKLNDEGNLIALPHGGYSLSDL